MMQKIYGQLPRAASARASHVQWSYSAPNAGYLHGSVGYVAGEDGGYGGYIG
jgi:hypothetical protein